MPSQLPERRAKSMSKLNPNAQPFHIPMLPHLICGGQVKRQGTEPESSPSCMVPLQEASFPLVYEHGLQLVFLTEPPEAVGGFPRYGCWYPHPHATYQPCSFEYNHGMYQLVNEQALEPTHGSHLHSDNKNSIRKRMSAKRNRWCQQKFPMGYGRKKTVAKRDQTEWKAKEAKPAEKSTGGCAVRRPIIPFPSIMEEAESSPTTTVMIRNIPNQYKFHDLLRILDDHCWEQNETANPAAWSKFDFVYLPMDYRKHALQGRLSNLGYAFVNFTTSAAAFKFYERFHGLVWNVTENRKTCEITAAQFQGKEALMRIFHEKVFRCESLDFLPVVFPDARDGFNRQIEGTPVGKHVRGLPR